MNLAQIACVALALVFAPACGGSGSGSSSPEDAVKKLIDAFNSGDKAAFTAAFPTKEGLAKALECSGDKGPWKSIEREIGRFDKQAKELEGMKFEFKSIEFKQDRKKVLKAGESKDGCKAVVDIELHRARVLMSVTKDGKTDDDGEGVELIKIGESWYMLDL